MSYIDERKAEIKTRLTAYRKAELVILEGNQTWVSPDGMINTKMQGQFFGQTVLRISK